MVHQISTDWKKMVLDKSLNTSSDVFADADFASAFEALSRAANNKLISKYSDAKIKSLITRILKSVDDKNRKLMYGKLDGILGIDQKRLARDENMNEQTKALILETEQWARKLRDETLEQYTTETLRAMSLGEGVDSINKKFSGAMSKRKNNAKMVARTQVSTFNSITTKIRAQNLGIEKAKWVTGGDRRVRPSHEDRDGKEFDLSKGLYSKLDGKWLLPGTDYQCRCTYDLIIPKELINGKA